MDSASPSSPHRKDNGRRQRGRSLRRREVLEALFASPWPWGAGLTLAVTALLIPGLRFEAVRYELGAISRGDIRAPYDFSYEDEVTTRSRREEAAQQVLDIYDFDGRASGRARDAIAAAFAIGREHLAKGGPTDAGRDELFTAVRDALGVQLSRSELSMLLEEGFAVELEESLAEAVEGVLKRDVVASKERLQASARAITRRDQLTGQTTILRDFSALLTPGEAVGVLEERIARLTDLSPAARRRAAELGARFVEPTLTFDFAETERVRQAARDSVEPVYFQVRKGKVIVRAGDEVNESVVRQLQVLAAAEAGRWRWASALGAFVLAAALMLSQWILLQPARLTASWKRKSFAMVGLVIVSHLALARLVFFLAGALGNQLLTPPFNHETAYHYMVPYAAVGILVTLLESRSAALVASVIFSVFLGLMSGNLHLSVFSLLSCLAAVLGYLHYKQRTALIKAGLLVGGVNVILALGVDLATEQFTPALTFGFDLACAFMGGAAVSVVVSFLLPGFESLLQRATDIKLLELSNHNIGLLRRLTIEAPGTYHHSVVVGSLSEAAAEAIGANAIFCRTAALYHDVGKLKKVDYFVENQVGANRHDKLSPRMSALIIASHIKEGIEMAKGMDLPQEIIDIIPQHHGTKLITYFYEKAKEFHDPSLGEVREEDFRYPGPKPQTKEAGIIMIADGVEAAARTLEDPSPARLKGVIRQIIDYIFLDGQLDESDLTLRDLEKISQSFLRVLVGMYHHRIDYPGFDFDKKVEPVVVQDEDERIRRVRV